MARSLSVMPGDKISAEVYAKYVDAASIDQNTTAGQTLLDLLTQIGAKAAGVVVDGAGYLTSTSSLHYAGLLDKSASSNTVPKAYLNWLIFDRNYLLLDGGYVQITSAAATNGTDSPHEKLERSDILIKEPGYVYIYLSNENATPVDMFFDDFKVTQVKSPVVQVDEYYPFGLTFNSYSRENSTPQDYKFNGKEEQSELALSWLDYGARMYDPALARWMVVDPLAEKKHWQTPYHYCSNDPVRRFDPDGKDDYTVDKKGNIALQKKTGDKQDKLIALGKSGKLAYDRKGNLKNSSHAVEKGILSQKNHQESASDPDNPSAAKVSRDHYEIKGQSESKSTGLFKFLAKNTSVEWTLSSGTDKGGKSFAVLITSHEESRVGGGTVLLNWYFTKGYTPTSDYHNHPN